MPSFKFSNPLVSTKTSKQFLRLSKDSRDSGNFSKWKKWCRQAGFAQRLARCCMLPDSPGAPLRRNRSKQLAQTAGVSCPPGQTPLDVQRVCQFREPYWFFFFFSFLMSCSMFSLRYKNVVRSCRLVRCAPPHHRSPGDLHSARRLFLLKAVLNVTWNMSHAVHPRG